MVLLLLAVPASAHAGVVPVAPVNGAVLTPGSVTYQVQVSQPGLELPFITVSTQPTLGPTGQLATAYSVDFLGVVDANATGLMQGTSRRFLPDGVYYWQPNDSDGNGPVWSFTLSTPPPPQPVSQPVSSACVRDRRNVRLWRARVSRYKRAKRHAKRGSHAWRRASKSLRHAQSEYDTWRDARDSEC